MWLHGSGVNIDLPSFDPVLGEQGFRLIYNVPCYKGCHKHKDVGLGMGQKPSFLNSGRTVKSSNAQGRC